MRAVSPTRTKTARSPRCGKIPRQSRSDIRRILSGCPARRYSSRGPAPPTVSAAGSRRTPNRPGGRAERRRSLADELDGCLAGGGQPRLLAHAAHVPAVYRRPLAREIERAPAVAALDLLRVDGEPHALAVEETLDLRLAALLLERRFTFGPDSFVSPPTRFTSWREVPRPAAVLTRVRFTAGPTIALVERGPCPGRRAWERIRPSARTETPARRAASAARRAGSRTSAWNSHVPAAATPRCGWSPAGTPGAPARLADEPRPVHDAEVLDVIDLLRREAREPGLERAAQERPDEEVRHGDGVASELAEDGGERHLARPRHVVDAAQARGGARAPARGNVLLVDELHHRVEPRAP